MRRFYWRTRQKFNFNFLKMFGMINTKVNQGVNVGSLTF